MTKTRTRLLIAALSDTALKNLKRDLGQINSNVTVSEAQTSDDALSIVARHGVDAALVSQSMLTPHHMSLLYGLKTANPNALCVMVADALTPANLQRAMRLGLYDCITSPVTGRDYNRICARSLVQTPPLPALVVEDDQQTRRHVMKTLRESTFNLSVSEAADLPLALSLCRSINYRYVFVDLDLPGLHRLQGAALLQREHKDCKVIPLASQQDRISADQVKTLGFAGILQKPIDLAALDRLLHRSLGLEMPNLLADDVNLDEPPDDNYVLV